jgi:protease-4
MEQNLDIEQTVTQQDGKTKKFRYVKGESKARKFFRVVFGSALGFILASVIISFLSILMMIGMVAALGSSDTEKIESNSVLELTLNAPIDERAGDNPFADMDIPYYNSNSIGLDDILASLDNAAKDDKIKGVSLNVKSVQASPATLEEIHDALLKFKESGKFVYAYSDYYTQGAYYLASVADKVFLNPKGEIDFRGLAFQIMFYKGLIDKLDIDVQVVKCGKFKSAVEPYLLDKMSEANREQLTVLGNSIWGKMLADISASRNISVEQLNAVADSMLILKDVNNAIGMGLVDAFSYPTDYRNTLKKQLGVKDEDALNLVSLATYRKSFKVDLGKGSDKIAIIYAVGEINDGKGSDNTIGDVTLCKEIRRAYKDKDVKAIVLRVNSPGGSALASEIIWNELENAKAAGKKVVTSMGDYAASGGYYISCNSDAIVAQPNTLTGSIGVFGMIPSVQRCLETKLGVTVDVVKTNAHSDAISGMRPMTEEEYNLMQGSVDKTYDTFLTRVSDGRSLTKAQVDSIGQGRVWAGTEALQLGLVDKLGNLKDAIALAAELAGTDSYKLVYYPEKKEWFETLFNKDQEEKEISAAIRSELGDLYPAYNGLQQIIKAKGVQARMPLEITIE